MKAADVDFDHFPAPRLSERLTPVLSQARLSAALISRRAQISAHPRIASNLRTSSSPSSFFVLVSLISIFCFIPTSFLVLFVTHHTHYTFAASLFTNILFITGPLAQVQPYSYSLFYHLPSNLLPLDRSIELRSLSLDPSNLSLADVANLTCIILPSCTRTCLYGTFFTPAFHDYSIIHHLYTRKRHLTLPKPDLLLVQLVLSDQLSDLSPNTSYFVPHLAPNSSKRLSYRHLCGTALSCHLIFSGCRKHKQ